MGLSQEFKDFLALHPVIGKLFRTAILLTIVFEIVKFAPPYVFKEIIDRVVLIEGGINLTVVMYLIGAYFGSLFLMTVVEWFSRGIMVRRINNAEFTVLKQIVQKLLSLQLQFHEDNNTGSSMAKILKGSNRIVELLFNSIDRILPIIIQTVLTLLVLLWVNWQIALTFTIFVPILLYTMYRDTEATQQYREQYHEHFDNFAGKIIQSMQNIRTVKDFHNEGKELHKATRLLKKYFSILEIRTKLGLRSLVIEDGIIAFARAFTLLLGVYFLGKGNISVGGLVFVITLSEKAYINLGNLHRVYYRVQDATPAIGRFAKLNDEKQVIEDNVNSPLQMITGDVVFDNVTFTYPKGEKALTNISFTIPDKHTVALVGRSGSGKSTMVKLLLRHADPQDGVIRISGHALSEYSFTNLRHGITVVSQDVELFNESIKDNIAYGVDSASMAEIIRVSKLAHAHEFITNFAKGYDTMIGERGVRLSGGQKQRLAIARALLRKPKVLIFDEATSSLDAESEKFIHQSIFELTGKVTLIIIAHRFATIEHADTVVLLDKGQLVEYGTPQQLMRKKGIFARLRKMQQLGDLT